MNSSFIGCGVAMLMQMPKMREPAKYAISLAFLPDLVPLIMRIEQGITSITRAAIN